LFRAWGELPQGENTPKVRLQFGEEHAKKTARAMREREEQESNPDMQEKAIQKALQETGLVRDVCGVIVGYLRPLPVLPYIGELLVQTYELRRDSEEFLYFYSAAPRYCDPMTNPLIECHDSNGMNRAWCVCVVSDDVDRTWFVGCVDADDDDQDSHIKGSLCIWPSKNRVLPA
jgi:hypothetical protein